jgi:hypothetical protein
MANSPINTFHGDTVRHIDPLKKADTALQRKLIKSDAKCLNCIHYRIKSGICAAKKTRVKFYNICKLHNLEILS